MNSKLYRQKVEDLKVVLLIPTYNHATFLQQVLLDCNQYPIPIIIVNDGSTDTTRTIIDEFSKMVDLSSKVYTIHFNKNKGKGAAIKAGVQLANSLGFNGVITIDSDGQHFPSDIINFVDKALEYQDSIIIGTRGSEQANKPKKNSTANEISNFWFRFQTSINLPDTQSGFRYYPISCFQKIHWLTDRYNFELEVMVRNIWRGFAITEIQIQIYYPPVDVRISHFRPTIDFLRITMLNTLLSIISIFYYHPKKLWLKFFHKTKKSNK
jgi:glycosyltransferase involved in cell wall biosynthesis